MEHRKPKFPESATERYRNPHLFGQGTTGATFLAYDNTLQRSVVIKTINAREARTEERLAQFRQKATRLSQLREEHVVSIYDIVEEDGDIYYVMQKIDGLSLRKTIEIVDFTLPEVIQLLSKCLCGLAAIHECGLLHGNLTLDAIIVDDDDHPFIGRFGLARAPVAPEIALRAGDLPETYRHIPPEILKGEKWNEKSDVYQLAFLAYEAITHIKPFSCDAIYEYVTRGKEPHLLPPSCLRKGIDGGLDKLILSGLAVDPAKRTATAEEMLDKLEEWLHGNKAEPPLQPPQLPKEGRRKATPSSSYSVRRLLKNAPPRFQLTRKKKIILTLLTLALLSVFAYRRFGERVRNYWRQPCRVTAVEPIALDRLQLIYEGDRSGYAIVTIPPSGQYHVTFHHSYQGKTTINLSRALIERTPIVITYVDNEPPISFQVDPRPLFSNILAETIEVSQEHLLSVTEAINEGAINHTNPARYPAKLQSHRGGLRMLISKKLKKLQLGAEQVRKLRPLRQLGTLARQGYLHSPPWGNISSLLKIRTTKHDNDESAQFILLASHFDKRAPSSLKRTIGQKFAQLPPRRVFLYKKTIGKGHTAWPLLGAKLIVHSTSFDERLALALSVNGRKPIFIYNPQRPTKIGSHEQSLSLARMNYLATGLTVEAPLDLALFSKGENTLHLSAHPLADGLDASFFLPISSVDLQLW
mgnify:CR=1 FL=1